MNIKKIMQSIIAMLENIHDEKVMERIHRFVQYLYIKK